MGFFLSQIYTHSSTYKFSLKESYAISSEDFISSLNTNRSDSS